LLVLTRKPGQTVVVGGQLLVVSVLEVKGNVVRLGFEADKDLNIRRGELVDEQQPAPVESSK